MRNIWKAKIPPGADPSTPLHLNIYFSNFTPTPLSEKLDQPLSLDMKDCHPVGLPNPRRPTLLAQKSPRSLPSIKRHSGRLWMWNPFRHEQMEKTTTHEPSVPTVYP